MRQETISTFNGGLTYDLNPLVTPNNVLTDAVNGTFITFNGNELSLQNDAGNTVINIKNTDEIVVYKGSDSYSIGDKVSTTDSTNKIRCWICVVDASAGESPITAPGKWQEYIVRLSPGFYPLAIKEYGGILYIVSGRNIVRMATYYQPGTIYNKDEVVRTGLDYLDEGLAGNYYISLKYNNTDDITNTLSWKSLGNITSAQEYNEIEFGSYPSPEGVSEDDGIDNTIKLNSTHLNVTRVLNDTLFIAGGSAAFSTDLNILDYVSRSEEPRFYNIKLIQQLQSGGEKDLTADINSAYTGATHWLFDSNFRFYNPSAYKGKLAIKISIVDLKAFKVTPMPIVFKSLTNTYEASFMATASFYTYAYTIGVSGFTITTNVGTIQYGTATIVNGTVQQEIKIIDIPSTEVGNNLIYSIQPIFTWGGSNQNSNDLPATYVQKYTANGILPILDQSYSIKLSFEKALKNGPDLGLNACSLIPELLGYRTMAMVPIVNSLNELVDMNFQVTTVQHVLELSTFNNPAVPNTKIIGLFNWDSNYKITSIDWAAEYMTSQYALNRSIVENTAIGTTMTMADPTCLLVGLTIELASQTNCVVYVTQAGTVESQTTSSSVTFMVKKDLPINIRIEPVEYEAYEIIEDVVNISEYTTYKYIPIAKLVTEYFAPPYRVVWKSGMDIGTVNVEISYQDPLTPYENMIPTQGVLTKENNNLHSVWSWGVSKIFETIVYKWYFTDVLPESLLLEYKNTKDFAYDYALYPVNDSGYVCFRKSGNFKIY